MAVLLWLSAAVSSKKCVVAAGLVAVLLWLAAVAVSYVPASWWIRACMCGCASDDASCGDQLWLSAETASWGWGMGLVPCTLAYV